MYVRRPRDVKERSEYSIYALCPEGNKETEDSFKETKNFEVNREIIQTFLFTWRW